MIKTNSIYSNYTAGIGDQLIAYCIEVPTVMGCTPSQPQITVTFEKGEPFVNGVSVVIPMTAKVSLKYVHPTTGKVMSQYELVEHFAIGTNGTAIPGSITIRDLGNRITFTKTKGCKSYALRIDGSFDVVTAA